MLLSLSFFLKFVKSFFKVFFFFLQIIKDAPAAAQRHDENIKFTRTSGMRNGKTYKTPASGSTLYAQQ